MDLVTLALAKNYADEQIKKSSTEQIGKAVDKYLEENPIVGTFPTLIDNITIEEEGVKEITLAIDLTICKEARFYISVPANNSGKTINYYVSTNNAYQGYNQGWLTSYTNIATGTTVYYKGITDTLGDFSYATGFQGANVDRPGDPGGGGTVTAIKSPRLVSKVTKLIWTDAETSFPVGTRVQTYMWG